MSSDSEHHSLSHHKTPRHVAIIMDGNGRWASERDLPRVAGHQEGAKRVRKVLETAANVGVRYITLYAFSSENWERPQSEVDALMDLFAHYLESERETFLSENIRLRSIGDRSRLPDKVRARLERLEQDTEHCDSLDLILAVSYGGRDEILRAVKKVGEAVLKDGLDPNGLTVQHFSRYLDTKEIPDPDLLIRTSGESRISNFLLWQLAYTEIVMTDIFWPDFSEIEFHRCLEEYSTRERRFGRSECIDGSAPGEATASSSNEIQENVEPEGSKIVRGKVVSSKEETRVAEALSSNG